MSIKHVSSAWPACFAIASTLGTSPSSKWSTVSGRFIPSIRGLWRSGEYQARSVMRCGLRRRCARGMRECCRMLAIRIGLGGEASDSNDSESSSRSSSCSAQSSQYQSLGELISSASEVFGSDVSMVGDMESIEGTDQEEDEADSAAADSDNGQDEVVAPAPEGSQIVEGHVDRFAAQADEGSAVEAPLILRPVVEASGAGASSNQALAAPAAGVQRPRGAKHCEVSVLGGIVRYYAGYKSMVAHCDNPKHGKNCRLTRNTSGSNRLGREGQGRPPGLLLAWLRAGGGHDVASAKEHLHLPQPSLAERQQAREAARALFSGATWHALSACERPRRSGEGEEPDMIP